MRKLSLILAILLSYLVLVPGSHAASFRRQAVVAITKVFPPSKRARAVAVSGCETVNFTDQLNEKSGARGIFQVIPANDGRALYTFSGELALRIQYSRLYDMIYSARVAFYLSKGGTDWHEWDCGRILGYA